MPQNSAQLQPTKDLLLHLQFDPRLQASSQQSHDRKTKQKITNTTTKNKYPTAIDLTDEAHLPQHPSRGSRTELEAAAGSAKDPTHKKQVQGDEIETLRKTYQA